MNYRTAFLTGIFSTLALTSSLLGCSGPEDNDPMGSGGLVATGGTDTGGAGTGGGVVGTGGISTGGVGTGGVGTGGAGTGGAGTGGAGTGGAGTGGSTGTGGMGTGGGYACIDPNADSNLEPTFAVVKQIMAYDLNGTCASSDCHGESDIHPEKLVLHDDAGLLDRMKTHVAHRCNDLLVVQPGEPENSALVRALKGECTDAEGKPLPRMPGGCMEVDCKCFYPSWMKVIEDWIAAGALDN